LRENGNHLLWWYTETAWRIGINSKIPILQVVSAQTEDPVIMLHPLLAPVTSIVAGVIVLIYPRILNYVVAIYLILTGVLGILGK
jgi:hypothetical protein